MTHRERALARMATAPRAESKGNDGSPDSRRKPRKSKALFFAKKIPLISWPRRVVLRWNFPYGRWTCADGREVLFDRDYCPIVERYPGEAPVLADPTEWVPWEHQEHFYNDDVREDEKLARGRDVLEQWGMLEPVTEWIEARLEMMREWQRTYGYEWRM